MRIRLRHVERGKDLSADHDHRAKAASLWTRCNANGLEKIRWTVPSKIAYRAHCTGKYNRFFRVHGSSDQICGFLERISSVRYYDARHFISRKVFSNTISQTPHSLDGHVRSGI